VTKSLGNKILAAPVLGCSVENNASADVRLKVD
jgi:hypothetical protein